MATSSAHEMDLLSSPFSSIFAVACAGEGRGGDLDGILWESDLLPELVQRPGSVFLMVLLTVFCDYI